MELTFKLSTDEVMSLNEAKDLKEISESRNLTPSEQAVDYIREGIRKDREILRQETSAAH